MKREGLPWWMPMASRFAALLLTVLAGTWRIRYAARDAELHARVFTGRRCIFAFWHARLLPLVFTHRRRGIAVLTSRHRDGEWISQVLEVLGFVTARGSSTRGGEAAVLAMLDHAASGRHLGITPDGPRGPARRVKPGLLYLAGQTGLPIVPLASASCPVWVLKSWDRFRIPKPFARVEIAYGEPILVPADLDEAATLQWCARLESAIDEVTARAGVAMGEPV